MTSDHVPTSELTPGKHPTHGGGWRILLVLLLGVAGASGWIFWNLYRDGRLDGRGGISSSLRFASSLPTGGRFPGDPYIGSAACGSCHPGEYALFGSSGHARTMHMAEGLKITDELAGKSAEDPLHPGVEWTFRKEGDQFLLDRKEDNAIRRFVIDYALGSGHHAVTFVTMLDLDKPKILEHRLTYYPGEKALWITPGHERGRNVPGSTPDGVEYDGFKTRKCLGCHATQLSSRGNGTLDPPTLIPTVTCERCHGPGRAHVEAATKGAPDADLTMPMGLGGWTVQTQFDLCGKCHRHPSRVPPDQLVADDPFLARFQPIGISQSRCFKEGKGNFSCVTCHDPHARASSDPAYYEGICLSCHRSSDTTHAADQPGSPTTGQASPCPVSPRANCLPCHMPKVESGQHIRFSDHWIRVHRPTPST